MQSVRSVARLGFSLQFWLYFTKSGCLVASERSFHLRLVGKFILLNSLTRIRWI